MFKSAKKAFMIILAVCIMLSFSISPAYAAELKIGYIDIRRAFYEYEKTKTMEAEIAAFTEDHKAKRDQMITGITKLRDEAELLAGGAKAKKQREVDLKLAELEKYDKTVKQDVLNKKNDMFRQVIEDVQVVADDIGKTGAYDYVIDSRNVMYALEKYDLTDEVVKRLNK